MTRLVLPDGRSALLVGAIAWAWELSRRIELRRCAAYWNRACPASEFDRLDRMSRAAFSGFDWIAFGAKVARFPA